jgi:hypothetical protein
MQFKPLSGLSQLAFQPPLGAKPPVFLRPLNHPGPLFRFGTRELGAIETDSVPSFLAAPAETAVGIAIATDTAPVTHQPRVVFRKELKSLPKLFVVEFLNYIRHPVSEALAVTPFSEDPGKLAETLVPFPSGARTAEYTAVTDQILRFHRPPCGTTGLWMVRLPCRWCLLKCPR